MTARSLAVMGRRCTGECAASSLLIGACINEEPGERAVDILSGKDPICLIVGDLDVDCVLLIEQEDSTTGHLVQEALAILIISEHNRLAVLIQSHQGMSSINMDAVGEIVNSRNMASENARFRVIVILSIVNDVVKLNWAASSRVWGGQRCSESRHGGLDHNLTHSHAFLKHNLTRRTRGTSRASWAHRSISTILTGCTRGTLRSGDTLSSQTSRAGRTRETWVSLKAGSTCGTWRPSRSSGTWSTIRTRSTWLTCTARMTFGSSRAWNTWGTWGTWGTCMTFVTCGPSCSSGPRRTSCTWITLLACETLCSLISLVSLRSLSSSCTCVTFRASNTGLTRKSCCTLRSSRTSGASWASSTGPADPGRPGAPFSPGLPGIPTPGAPDLGLHPYLGYLTFLAHRPNLVFLAFQLQAHLVVQVRPQVLVVLSHPEVPLIQEDLKVQACQKQRGQRVQGFQRIQGLPLVPEGQWLQCLPWHQVLHRYQVCQVPLGIQVCQQWSVQELREVQEVLGVQADLRRPHLGSREGQQVPQGQAHLEHQAHLPLTPLSKCDWRHMHSVAANQSTRQFQSKVEFSFQSKVQLAVASIHLAAYGAPLCHNNDAS
ncbi:hypothetical protein FQN60_008776 [Etheostoma spectabile]|uniref:Uncharacterized protein n=1 Tax=Etheostoma spectabile TaxID=54343 RepID=A0A5J5CN40_9PERO|nr:hypothetical protein FQN60_018791 [Etheostoma spectabile]KAA8582036.1 hypothetical protein FQN60_008776 [Etheostoma spectabile]